MSAPTVSVTIRDEPVGRTVFARIPCSAPSMAMALASPAVPAFAAA